MRPQEAVLNAKMFKCAALVMACSFSTLVAAQEPSGPDTEGWRELPRNTTIYVPVPRQVVPVEAYRSCSNRYEGDSCDFSSPNIGIVEGTCEAPEIRQPPAYGYEQRQYPAQIRTGLVCRPAQADSQPQDGAGGMPPSDPSNPGREMPYPPRQQ